MVTTSTNTTPSSCGATSGSDNPHTPKNLTSDSIDQYDRVDVDTAAELSPSHTFASTPSSSPNNATTAGAGGDNLIIQDRPVRSAAVDNDMFESVLGLRKLKGKEPKYDMSRVIFGCMFAYVVLGLWVSRKTIFLMIIILFQILTILFACSSRSGQYLH
jgi:hypothetical protein